MLNLHLEQGAFLCFLPQEIPFQDDSYALQHILTRRMFRYGSLSCFWLSESIRFVVNVIKDAVSLVGSLDQVAGFVVIIVVAGHITTKIV